MEQAFTRLRIQQLSTLHRLRGYINFVRVFLCATINVALLHRQIEYIRAHPCLPFVNKPETSPPQYSDRSRRWRSSVRSTGSLCSSVLDAMHFLLMYYYE